MPSGLLADLTKSIEMFGFDTLALLASLPRVRVPIVIGELAAGLIVGRTGFGIVDHADPTFTLLADIGFALVMFIVGTDVPVRDKTRERPSRRRRCVPLR